MCFHLVFLKRFQFRCLLTNVELVVSHPWGKQREHPLSFPYTILETWTFEILTGKSISPNSLKPNAFRISFCFFIKSLIRLNLMQCYFDSVFKIFHNALKNANILRISMILAEQSNQTSESPNCICGCKNRNLMKLTLTKAVCYWLWSSPLYIIILKRKNFLRRSLWLLYLKISGCLRRKHWWTSSTCLRRKREVLQNQLEMINPEVQPYLVKVCTILNSHGRYGC